MADDLQLAFFAAVIAAFVFIGCLPPLRSERSPYGRTGNAFLTAVNIAKLPSVPRQIMKDSHGRQWKALKSKTLSEKERV